MIVTFQDKATQDIFDGVNSREARSIPSQLWSVTARKLDMINAAHSIQDLLVPPGNRLKKLVGDYKGFYSIRINDQYRIIFRWSNDNAEAVKVIDYHG